MDKPRVVVTPRAKAGTLFNVLQMNRNRQSYRRLDTLCDKQVESQRVGWLSDSATHLIRVYVGKTLKTFGYVDIKPYPAGDYVNLILLCGRYRSGGPYPWKGSQLIVDKAIQLARDAGKTAIRLEALNEQLLAKVYRPMGFKDLPGRPLEAELRPLPPSGGLRLNVERRRTQRNRGGRKHPQLDKLTTRRC